MDRQERRAIEKLLPFHDSGTLDAEETARVERALEADAELREELAFLHDLRTGVHAATEVPSAGDLGWARLQSSIRRERRKELVSRAWRPALALAAGLALVVQGMTIFRLNEQNASLAGGPPTAELQITFAPDAREVEIRALLQEVGATIVDGPGPSGVYRLDIEPDPAGDAQWQALIGRLEGNPELVEHVARERGE
ncbi:MAG: hypothetical protein CL910_20915 [Deltaproteobacteria bacterium]|nr:hypothetical protein [Deltaproteobacteria bacterium]